MTQPDVSLPVTEVMTVTIPNARAADHEADADLLAAVIEVAPTPLWVIAGSGRVELVNQAAVALLGYSTAADLVGRPSHCALHERHPDGSRYPQDTCPIVASAAAAGPTRGTEWFTTSTGSPLPVTWSTRRLRVRDATLLAFEDASATPHSVTSAEGSVGTRTRAAMRAELLRHIHDDFRDPAFSVSALAKRNHMSVRSVQALFAEAGKTPGEAIRRARLEFACLLLERGASVQSACYDSGFSDPGTFSRAFRRHYGRSPTHFLRAPA